MSTHNYVGADGSYPEIAARAVTEAARQNPSPVYGYHRVGTQQKIYLFGAIADAQGWFGSLVHGAAQPYDYVAVFAATDLSRAVPGLESFGHTVVSGGGAYVGADGSYPEVAARAVAHAAQQAPSALYGYLRVGYQQKVYLFATPDQASGWLSAIVQGGQPYDYAAVFAQGDLSRPMPGFESFGHAAVSGTYVGQILPFLLGLPLGGLAGYFLRRWQEENPGHALPFVPPTTLPGPKTIPAIPSAPPKASGQVGGPWLDIEPLYSPYVGGPWVDMVGPQVGGPWVDLAGPYVGGPWVDLAGPQVGGPWVDIVGAAYDSDAERRRRWPETRALIETAKRHAVSAQAQAPAAAWVWSLDALGAPDGDMMIMPFGSVAEGQAYLFERLNTPHIALALFEAHNPHWPNPIRWSKNDDPAYASIIAQRVASQPRSYVGGTVIGSALDDVRKKAESLAARRAGSVIGVIHTSKDDLWHTLAFRSADDADDWINTATQDPASYTYAAYFDKQGDSWPHAYVEKISGMRAPPGTEVPRRSASVGRHHSHGWGGGWSWAAH